jgi:tetratricopeptide (TPR) repeat protein
MPPCRALFVTFLLLAATNCRAEEEPPAAEEEPPAADDDDDMDCEMSAWGDFSSCDVSCGAGFNFRKRTIQTPALGKGAACPRDLQQRGRCDAGPCPEVASKKKKKVEDKREVITSVSMDLTQTETNGAKTKRQVDCVLHQGDDVAVAAFRFCFEEGLATAEQVVQIAKMLQAKADEEAYTPPKKQYKPLASSAAYANRAKKLAKEGKHTEAGGDYTRAALFEGITPAQVKKFNGKLDAFMKERENEEKKADEEAVKKAEAKAAKAKRKEAKKKAKVEMQEAQAQQETTWKNFQNSSRNKANSKFWGKAKGEGADAEREVVAEMGLRLTKTTEGKEAEAVPVNVEVVHGMDAAHAAFHFCTAFELPPSETIKITGQVQKMLDGKDYDESNAKRLPTAGEYLERAQKLLTDGSFSDAGADFTRAVQKDGSLMQQAQHGLEKSMRMLRLQHDVEVAYDNQSWPEAMVLLRKIQEDAPRSRNATRMLLQAHVHTELHEWMETVKECQRTLSVSKKRGKWKDHEPRMIAVTLGARAAMEMGSSEKALDFYRAVLKNDPENTKVEKAYARMRTLLKLLDKAEKHLDKGYNHKALDALDEAMLKVQGTVCNTPKFRSRVLIKLCRARSEVRQHEKALDDCNEALDYLGEGDGEKAEKQTTFANSGDAVVLTEAYEARARAHFNDENFGEAVRDYQEAIEWQGKTGAAARGTQEGNEKRNALNGKLHESQNKVRMHSEERRDHAKILELPVNIHEVNQQSKCGWLKKQHKKLAKKWHPDKNKGDKRRAARKMDEISAAKAALIKQWGCKGIR